MNKEVRAAQVEYQRPEEREYSDQLTAQEMLKRFPKKAADKKRALVAALEKGVKQKKQPPKRNPSKRTTPGEISSLSAPAFAHKEGARWAQTLKLQSRIQRKSLQKKMSKKKT